MRSGTAYIITALLFSVLVLSSLTVTARVNPPDVMEPEIVAADFDTTTEELVQDDAPFMVVEQMPLFMEGDLRTFRDWVVSMIEMPTDESGEPVAVGRVICQFVIEKDGNLAEIQILRSPHKALSDEVERVLRISPKWEPGRQRGTAVKVQFVLPIEFTVQ